MGRDSPHTIWGSYNATQHLRAWARWLLTAWVQILTPPLTSSVMLGSYFIQVYFPTYNTGRKMSTLKACHENI